MDVTAAKIGRRDFVAGGALFGAGAAMATSAIATKAQALEEVGTGVPESWDYEADVIAIGAGGAGLAGAVEAAEQGLSIIVLEATGLSGGNSILCGGGICIPGTPLQEAEGIEDSADIMYEDLCAWFQQDYYDEYVRMLCDLNSGLYDWLTGLGIEFLQSGLLQSNGHSRPREHHVRPAEVIGALESKALETGAQIHFMTAATHLIQNPATKRIIGVTARAEDGSELHYKAKKGVLLCSGGYSKNQDMLCDWNFGSAIYDMPFASASACQDGSGIRMALEVGADTRHMSYCAMFTAVNPDGKDTDACAMYHQGAILVNMEGKRFVNEAQGYTNVWSELLQQPDAVCYQIWDDAIAQEFYDNDSEYYCHKRVEETGLLLSADTIEELAEQMGVPADTLAQTLATYNEDVADDGVDSEFGREHTSGTGIPPFPLDTPPYYAFKTTCSMGVTYGGIRQDVNQGSQAVSVTGEIIPSLFLAGNISDYCNMGCVPGTRRPINASGVSMGGAMSFGRRCVQEMAKLDSWDE